MVLKYRNIIISIFIFFLSVGLVSTHSYNTLNVKLYFELLLIVLFILQLDRIKLHKEIFLYIILSFLIILYGYTNVIIKQDKITDFVYIYKTFYYLIILSFFIGKTFFNTKSIKKLFYIVSIFFLMKYTYTIFLGFMHRPGIFTENNFELMLLLFIYHIKIQADKNFKISDYTLIFLIILLSSSRSAIISLAYLTLFIDFKNKAIYKTFKYALVFSIGLIMILIIYARLDGMNIEDIDRVRFLFVFLDEIKNWNIIEYLLGNSPITPLSQTNCSTLAYYSPLFSNVETNLCYSVVLHSYILRTILDHGILGLIFIFSFLYKILKSSKLNNKDILIIFGILFINSLSVSSLNSIFAILGLLIIMTTKRTKETYAKTK